MTAEVTFKLVGPLKRSTFSTDASDPTEEVIGDLLHWSWSTRLQICRFSQGLRAELTESNSNSRLNSRRRFSATTYDEHMLVVAAANLQRALRKAKRTVREQATLPESSQRALWLLRNMYEHWDELKRQFRAGSSQLKGAAQKLKKEFPSADPWSCTIDPKTKEVVLADVVALQPFAAELRRLEARLLRLERRRKKQAGGLK